MFQKNLKASKPSEGHPPAVGGKICRVCSPVEPSARDFSQIFPEADVKVWNFSKGVEIVRVWLENSKSKVLVHNY